jgi:hypothetical protein
MRGDLNLEFVKDHWDLGGLRASSCAMRDSGAFGGAWLGLLGRVWSPVENLPVALQTYTGALAENPFGSPYLGVYIPFYYKIYAGESI